VINESDHDVNVTDAGLVIQTAAGLGKQTWSRAPAATLPRRVAARDRGFTYREYDPLGVPGGLLHGWATTATRETYRSEAYPEGGLVTHSSFFPIIRIIREAMPPEPWSARCPAHRRCERG
jgi:hypothetical protein